VSDAPDRRGDLARRMLSQHRCSDELERRAVDETLGLIARVPAPFARTTLPGHITASAIVLDESREHVLVVWHSGLARWLQPGGHSEPDDVSPAATAAREAVEETGIPLAFEMTQPPLVHVDVHGIPARGAEPAHRHHDLRFAFIAAAEAVPPLAQGAGSGWVRVDALAALGADASLLAAVARAQSALPLDIGEPNRQTSRPREPGTA
jgi:8-oxo-dGTP pyrophosphatase MutT (NUDIX family)